MILNTQHSPPLNVISNLRHRFGGIRGGLVHKTVRVTTPTRKGLATLSGLWN
jgi:hypothetical protein